MNNTIDLHIHSTASDGTVSPTGILKEALEKKLEYISLTDHESVEGYKELLKIKYQWKPLIKIIPGLELHTFYKGYEIHLLGYFIDVNSDNLNKKLQKIRQARTEIAFETVQRLKKSGIKINWVNVQEIVQGDIAVTKAHILRTLKKLGVTFDKQMFYNFFHFRGKYYISFKQHYLEDAIQFIKDAKGIPILAHPGLIGNDDIVKEILTAFHIGIEVYYHYFGDKAELWREKYKKLADSYGVIMTGGTDYHGSITSVELGDTFVPENVIEKLKLNKNCLF